MSASATLPSLDTERWRQLMAGLIDDSSGPDERDDLKNSATSLVYCLARLYNRDVLDAMKIWERIGGALETACQQVDDGDLDRFMSICLDHVKAKHARVAADEEAGAIIANVVERDESFRLSLVRYIHTHSYIVLVHGRRMWETHKETR